MVRLGNSGQTVASASGSWGSSIGSQVTPAALESWRGKGSASPSAARSSMSPFDRLTSEAASQVATQPGHRGDDHVRPPSPEVRTSRNSRPLAQLYSAVGPQVTHGPWDGQVS